VWWSKEKPPFCLSRTHPCENTPLSVSLANHAGDPAPSWPAAPPYPYPNSPPPIHGESGSPCDGLPDIPRVRTRWLTNCYPRGKGQGEVPRYSWGLRGANPRSCAYMRMRGFPRRERIQEVVVMAGRWRVVGVCEKFREARGLQKAYTSSGGREIQVPHSATACLWILVFPRNSGGCSPHEKTPANMYTLRTCWGALSAPRDSQTSFWVFHPMRRARDGTWGLSPYLPPAAATWANLCRERGSPCYRFHHRRLLTCAAGVTT